MGKRFDFESKQNLQSIDYVDEGICFLRITIKFHINLNYVKLNCDLLQKSIADYNQSKNGYAFFFY